MRKFSQVIPGTGKFPDLSSTPLPQTQPVSPTIIETGGETSPVTEKLRAERDMRKIHEQLDGIRRGVDTLIDILRANNSFRTTEKDM